MRIRHNLNDVVYITEVIDRAYLLKWYGCTINGKPITNVNIIDLCYKAMADESTSTMHTLCRKSNKILSKVRESGEDVIYV